MSATAKKSTNNTQVIYDMPEEKYHALERLSSSGIKKVLVSAQDFWKTSWMNEDKEEVEKRAFHEGKAYHKRLLEGKEAFNQTYVIKPKCDRRTKEGKNIYNEWLERQIEDYVEVETDVKKYIDAAIHRIETKPKLAKYFTGGIAEVTLLWDDPETNVPMKARIDYITDEFFVDLKTFSNSQGKNIQHVITSQIANYKYYVQAAVYREAIENVLGKPGMSMCFFFQQTGMVNNAIPLLFDNDLLLAQQGYDFMRKGIERFADLYRKYGTSEWFEELEIELTDESFPLYVYDG